MARSIKSYLLGLLLYGVVWTTIALVTSGAIQLIISRDLNFALTWVFFGGYSLLWCWPINVVWVGWLVLFGAAQIVSGRLQTVPGRSPASPARLRAGLILGIVQAIVAGPVSQLILTDPGRFTPRAALQIDGWPSALAICGTAAFIGSVAGAYVLGLVSAP